MTATNDAVESGEEQHTEQTEKIGLGECPLHGYVTENDGARIHFPLTPKCHCDRELIRATVASAEEVSQYV